MSFSSLVKFAQSFTQPNAEHNNSGFFLETVRDTVAAILPFSPITPSIASQDDLQSEMAPFTRTIIRVQSRKIDDPESDDDSDAESINPTNFFVARCTGQKQEPTASLQGRVCSACWETKPK